MARGALPLVVYRIFTWPLASPPQGQLKREAGESAVAEQASAVEAVRAENAAALAKLAENEARARALRDGIRDLRAAHDAQVCPAPEKLSCRHSAAEMIGDAAVRCAHGLS